MKYKNRQQKPIAYLSKSLNKTKRDYKIHNNKMLVVIRRLENQRYLLEDVKFKFEVWTDHKNLKYFMKVQKLNKRQAYWALNLSRFNFILKYVPETKIEKADRLSKRLNWKVGVEKNNKN